MPKQPAFQFYPGDWLRDGVAGCSLAAQGLWLRLMIVMHDSPQYGCLTDNGTPMRSDMAARRCGCTLAEYQTLLMELETAHVPRHTEDNIMYSKRMVDDEKRRIAERVKKRNQRANTVVPPHVPKMSLHSSSSSSSSLKKKQAKRKDGECVFSLPEWMPISTWELFLAHRKAVKAPVVESAYPSFIAKFKKLDTKGWPPGKVVDLLVEKGWRWFNPDWQKGDRPGAQAQVDNPLSRQKASDIISKWQKDE